ncbi:hypothetical protein DM02DRAFT_632971 [Periconia macrospinosa]|uniref:Uncharacterized protein n=1 Tax=Periconia macrospinosa TaxID=97972 RepID=A0A2V1DB26_9PLEO|nr:hypothetical protein DM02DRAFT_632971 [Periconia macrospinosa]
MKTSTPVLSTFALAVSYGVLAENFNYWDDGVSSALRTIWAPRQEVWVTRNFDDQGCSAQCAFRLVTPLKVFVRNMAGSPCNSWDNPGSHAARLKKVQPRQSYKQLATSGGKQQQPFASNHYDSYRSAS